MDYYILVEPWAVYVKQADFFVEQGGLTAAWGKKWKKVTATGIDDARAIGEQQRTAMCRVANGAH